MAQAATQSISTPAGVEAEEISPATVAMLRPFFAGWRGEAPEPALPSPVKNRPAPAAVRELVAA